MPVSTAAYEFKNAFYLVAKALFDADADVLVSFGHPGLQVSDDMILFLDVTSSQDTATISTNRTREETLTLQVFVSSYAAGELDNDLVPTARVYELLGALEDYVRSTDTSLGGTVRHCFLTEHTSQGSTDPQVLGGGRMVDCVATFTAQVRISN